MAAVSERPPVVYGNKRRRKRRQSVFGATTRTVQQWFEKAMVNIYPVGTVDLLDWDKRRGRASANYKHGLESIMRRAWHGYGHYDIYVDVEGEFPMTDQVFVGRSDEFLSIEDLQAKIKLRLREILERRQHTYDLLLDEGLVKDVVQAHILPHIINYQLKSSSFATRRRSVPFSHFSPLPTF